MPILSIALGMSERNSIFMSPLPTLKVAGPRLQVNFKKVMPCPKNAETELSEGFSQE
jgi:hypothetical protein